MSSSSIAPAPLLLHWYDRHRRRLPWRAEPGQVADPYRVWLSEIMLQQTTVAAVIPYFDRFVTRFPTVEALAAAPLETVLAAWAGLGYYARARNLHACAQQVAAMGGFPAALDGLQALPGIGAYTAAAIGAIAFGIPAIPVDGNVERVAARLFAIEQPLPAAKPALRAAAERLADQDEARARPSDFAQALFDLGASLCSPTQPACGLCPWRQHCEAQRLGIAAGLPRKEKKKPRPIRYGVHFWLTDAHGNVLLRRRETQGLLGGMTELPGTPWRETAWDAAEALALAPQAAAWRPAGQVRHGFTHFELIIDLFAAEVAEILVPRERGPEGRGPEGRGPEGRGAQGEGPEGLEPEGRISKGPLSKGRATKVRPVSPSEAAPSAQAPTLPAIQNAGFLHPRAALDQEALPSVMRKCVRMASSV